MRQGMRGGLVGVGSVIVALALHVVVLQVWLGPYPISSRWWADAYAIMPVVMAVVVARAAADMGDARAAAWLQEREVAVTPSARRYARRWVSLTRACRAIGFFGVGLFGVVAVLSVNTSGLAVDDPVRQRLLDVASGVGWSATIVGYAVGALVAEVLRRPPSHDGSRRADLRSRVPAAYMQPMARWGPRVLGVAALLTAGLTAAFGHDVLAGPSSAELAITAAATMIGTEATRWAVVRHRQRAADPDDVALDDAARATTIHAVSGSAIAIIGWPLGGHLWNVAVDLTGPLRWVGMLGGVVGVVSLGVWLGYGVGLAWVVRRAPGAGARPARHRA